MLNPCELADVPITGGLAEAIAKNAPGVVYWRLEAILSGQHYTICHPAALEAFREFFEPVASN